MEHYCIFKVLINSVPKAKAKYSFVIEFDNYRAADEYLITLNHFFCPVDCYYVLRNLDDSEFANRFNFNPYNYGHKQDRI